jgi:hypothetical protein
MIDRLIHRPSGQLLAAISFLSLVANILATSWLNASYAASRFPVPYHEAQLSFSAPRLKIWYAQLIEFGTLDLYLQTQYIDHLFILTVLVLHSATLLWVSRMFPVTHRARRLLVIAALLSAIAPIADTLENVVSYVMLADPKGFPEGLAWLYSTLAALKFAAFTFAYAALIVGVIAGLAWLWKHRRNGP